MRRGPRERVLEIELTKHGWEIEFGPAAKEIYHLPLLTMFALHAVLVESDRPGGCNRARLSRGPRQVLPVLILGSILTDKAGFYSRSPSSRGLSNPSGGPKPTPRPIPCEPRLSRRLP